MVKILEDWRGGLRHEREWNGRNQRFTLRAHIGKHREAHNEMMRASQHVDYELPNEHTRVGRLIKSITSKEPAIVSAITHIQGSTTQREDFETAAEFLLLTAPSPSSSSGTHRISAVGKGAKGGKRGPETGVELRYYTKKEYSGLSAAEKKELQQLRKASSKSNNNDSNNIVVAALQQQVKELEERLVAAIKTNRPSSETTVEKRSPLTNPLNQRS